tara:strand:- start:32840 stop:33328 length:489 start_codon:yes stop_codon:yes gene_type:complete
MPSPKKKPTLVLDEYVPGLISWLHNKYASDGSEVYRRHFGIGIAEWNVLAYLGVFGSGSGAEMSRFLGMDKAAVSRAANKLKTKKFLTSRSLDKRTTEFALTPEGQESYECVTHAALARESVLLEGLTATERRTVIKLIHKMLDNLPKVYEFGGALDNHDKD